MQQLEERPLLVSMGVCRCSREDHSACVICSHLLYDKLRLLGQRAERWCIPSCQLNPFWDIRKEVMWLCLDCQKWYHYVCCTTMPHNAKEPVSLCDYVSLPILKGGCMGKYGTAPIVHAAARLLDSGENGKGEVKVMLEKELCASAVDVLPSIRGEAKKFINSSISCPVCDIR